MASRFVAALALACVTAAQAQTLVVGPELWDRPRSAGAVLNEPVLKKAVGGYLAHPAARLVIHHGSGPEPLLQAEELRSWLIALAVEPQRVALAADLKPGEAIRIEVVTPR